jgi:hypothetical protein
LPVVSKLLERAVHQQLSTYLDENNLLSLQQFGFTDDAALQHLQRLTTVYCWKNCLAVESVIMILSGFNHTSRIGIKLCIMIMRTLTIKQPVQIGVVQGSILGPLLFTMFLNDLPNILNNSKITLYICGRCYYIPEAIYYAYQCVYNYDLESNFNVCGQHLRHFRHS